jgi:hypothetical protein
MVVRKRHTLRNVISALGCSHKPGSYTHGTNLHSSLINSPGEPLDLLLVLNGLALAANERATQGLQLDLRVLHLLAELIKHLLQPLLFLVCDVLSLHVDMRYDSATSMNIRRKTT